MKIKIQDCAMPDQTISYPGPMVSSTTTIKIMVLCKIEFRQAFFLEIRTSFS